METGHILYYSPSGTPRSVRIISNSLGINTTIIPKLNNRDPAGSYYNDLISLSKNTMIDNIFTVFDSVLCDDERCEPWGLCEMTGELIDICQWDFFLLSERENGRRVTPEMYQMLGEKFPVSDPEAKMASTHYMQFGLPTSVRIISESLGVDTTIFPELHKAEIRDRYCDGLSQLAKSPQINHIYASCSHLFREDTSGHYVDESESVIDFCDKDIFVDVVGGASDIPAYRLS